MEKWHNSSEEIDLRMIKDGIIQYRWIRRNNLFEKVFGTRWKRIPLYLGIKDYDYQMNPRKRDWWKFIQYDIDGDINALKKNIHSFHDLDKKFGISKSYSRFYSDMRLYKGYRKYS